MLERGRRARSATTRPRPGYVDPSLPPAHRGPVRPHRALDARWRPATIHWRSITRDNVTTLYGDDARRSRIADPGDPARVFSWLICESYDDKGNAIVYEYAAEDDDGRRPRAGQRAQPRPRTAEPLPEAHQVRQPRLAPRPAGPGADGLAVRGGLRLRRGPLRGRRPTRRRPRPSSTGSSARRASPAAPWAARPDPFSSHRAGFEVRTYRRCRRVLMFHHFPELGDRADCLVRVDRVRLRRPRLRAQPADASTTSSPIRAAPASPRSSARHAVRLRPRRHAAVSAATASRTHLPQAVAAAARVRVQQGRRSSDEVRELDAESLENLPGRPRRARLPVGRPRRRGRLRHPDRAGRRLVLQAEPRRRRASARCRRVAAEAVAGGARRAAGSSCSTSPATASSTWSRFGGPTPGFFERTDDGGWAAVPRRSAQLPERRLGRPEPALRRPRRRRPRRRPDHRATTSFTWYPSLGEDGLRRRRDASASRSTRSAGPRLVFADGTQSIYLADMSRRRPHRPRARSATARSATGPTSGYGRFGAKVTMDNAPWFDDPTQFDQRRIRLADIDGSGTTDIIYLGARRRAACTSTSPATGWSDAAPPARVPAGRRRRLGRDGRPARQRHRLPGLVVAAARRRAAGRCATST